MRTRFFLLVALLASASGCVLHLDGDDDDGSSGKVCGGFAGAACPDDEFCDFPEANQCGIADGSGTCQTRPTACPEIYAPVIGSDGQVYDNACFAHAAGVDDCGPAPVAGTAR